MVPGHEAAQGWGYVVAGYFLIEQGLKVVLHVRGVEPPKMHAMAVLFAELPEEDQDVLRAYYDDFRHTFPGMSSFPLATLDEFLVNLDGTRDSPGSLHRVVRLAVLPDGGGKRHVDAAREYQRHA